MEIPIKIRERYVPPSYYSYQMFTLAIVNPQLDVIAFQGAKLPGEMGYRAYPFPANMPHQLQPSREYPGGPGDISHKHVAVACGLGRIGWHNLLLTPQYGTRQKLTTILTNAPLSSDPIHEGDLCDPVRCGFQCARACPTGAIPVTTDKRIELRIAGKPVQYAQLVGWRFRWGCSGMLKCTGGSKDIPLSFPGHRAPSCFASLESIGFGTDRQPGPARGIHCAFTESQSAGVG